MGDSIVATVTITNTGEADSSSVVQIYAARADRSANEYARQLIGFGKVRTEAGHATTVEVTCSLIPLSHRDAATREWRSVAGDYEISAAQFAGDPDAATTTLALESRLVISSGTSVS